MRFLLHFPNSRFCDSIYFFPTFSKKLFSSSFWRRFLSLKTNANFQFRRMKLRFLDSGSYLEESGDLLHIGSDLESGDLHHSGSDLEPEDHVDSGADLDS